MQSPYDGPLNQHVVIPGFCPVLVHGIVEDELLASQLWQVQGGLVAGLLVHTIHHVGALAHNREVLGGLWPVG